MEVKIRLTNLLPVCVRFKMKMLKNCIFKTDSKFHIS